MQIPRGQNTCPRLNRLHPLLIQTSKPREEGLWEIFGRRKNWEVGSIVQRLKQFIGAKSAEVKKGKGKTINQEGRRAKKMREDIWKARIHN